MVAEPQNVAMMDDTICVGEATRGPGKQGKSLSEIVVSHIGRLVATTANPLGAAIRCRILATTWGAD
jgi:hypothetical protein